MFQIEKKLFLTVKKKKFLSLKNRIFPKGLTHAFGEKMQFFYYSFSTKIRLEIRFNNVLDFFYFLFSLKIRLEMRFDNVLDRKETFFLTIYKNELHSVSGHLSVNWRYLIIETKTEKLGKCLFYGFLLWKLPSVEEMSEEEVFF